jgi:hypothetical protein
MKKHIDKSDLASIPGIGPSMKKDLIDIGINSIPDLAGKNPESLYNKLCKIRNAKIDRCVLYEFRCAVYFAENDKYDPELLKWWNWMDKKSEI